jgi:hypothetical protein
MATVSTTISLSSAAGDLTSNALTLSDSVAITAGNTTGLARRPITSTAKATASGQVTIYTADDFAAIAYIYIKNTDATATDYIYVYDDTTTGDPVILKLAGGDWAFLPTIADKTLKAYATTSGTIIESMVFGTDQ